MVRSATALAAAVATILLAAPASTLSAQGVVSMPIGSGCTNCGSASSGARVTSYAPVVSGGRVISGSGCFGGASYGRSCGTRSFQPAYHGGTRVYRSSTGGCSGQACGSGTACGPIAQGTVIEGTVIEGTVIEGPVGQAVSSQAVSGSTVSHGRVVAARVAGASSMSTVGGSSSGVGSVLAALNSQRARQGLAGLRYDPQLQAVAQRRAQQMAATGNKNHPPGSFSPGRYEGVGWSSSFSPSGVSACYTSDPRMTVAGAAMATGRDGVYFCVVYR